MLEELVSHEIATEYQPVEVEKFSSRGSDQPRLLFCSLYFITLHTIKLLSNTKTIYYLSLEILKITIVLLSNQTAAIHLIIEKFLVLVACTIF